MLFKDILKGQRQPKQGSAKVRTELGLMLSSGALLAPIPPPKMEYMDVVSYC